MRTSNPARKRIRDFRGVLRPVGGTLMGYGGAIAICALLAAGFQWLAPFSTRVSGGYQSLGISALVTFALGVSLFVFGGKYVSGTVTRREATLAVAFIWLATSVCGAMPFVLGARMTVWDAFFESVSGLTTTGATAIADIEGTLSAPLLLWRSAIQWLGGMGIVVLFVAVFPSVGVGGKHMFRGEVPGATAEGLKPRIAETAIVLWRFYVAFTLIEFAALWLLGMHPFEALCHALTTMSTGGFSTRNASVAAFESAPIEYVIGTFMLLGSVNYGLYFAAMRGRSLAGFWRSPEFRAFVAIVGFAIVSLTIGILGQHGGDVLESFRNAFFMVGTTVSSTGYGTDDYMAYPAPILSLVIGMMFIGGCAGSTAGGIKIERIVLMAKHVRNRVGAFFQPNVVKVVRMGKRPVDRDVIEDVTVFFVVYTVCVGAGVLVFGLIEGVTVPTSFGMILTCLSNMGPSPFYEVADNFATFSPGTKLFSSLAMLLGRLEFFTLFSLLFPGFWTR